MMGFNVGTIYGEVRLNTGNWTSGVALIGRGVSGIKGALGGMTSSISGAAQNLTYLGAALSGVSAFMVKMAADAVETQNMFNIAMGKMANEAKKWIKDFSDSVGGLNQFELMNMLGTFDLMIKNMGTAEDAALKMSEAMTQLTFDMASLRNLKPEEAFLKIQSGLSGELEPLKRIGIVVSQELTQIKAQQLGLIKDTSETMSESMKIYVRFRLIIDQMGADYNDLYRTQNTFTNLVRLSTGAIKELAATLGGFLLPPLVDFASRMRNVVEELALWVEQNAEFSSSVVRAYASFGLLASMMGSTLLVIPFLRLAFVGIVQPIISVSVALTGLTIRVGLLGAAIAILAAPIYYITALYRKNFMGMKDTTDDAANYIRGKWAQFSDWMSKEWAGRLKGDLIQWGKTLGTMVLLNIQSVVRGIMAVVNSIRAFGAEMLKFFEKLMAVGSDFGESMKVIVKELPKAFVDGAKAAGDAWKTAMDTNYAENWMASISKSWDSFTSDFFKEGWAEDVFSMFKTSFDSILVVGDQFKEDMGSMFDFVKGKYEGMLASPNVAPFVDLAEKLKAAFQNPTRSSSPPPKIEVPPYSPNGQNTRPNGFAEQADKYGIRTTKQILEEKAALEALLKTATDAKDPVAIRGIADELNKLNEELVKTTGSFQDMFNQGFKQGFRELIQEWGDLSSQIAEGVTSIGRSFSTGLASGLTDIITRTKTAKEVFQDFIKSMITGIIQTVLQIAINFVIAKALTALFVTSSAGMAAGLASAWAPAATMVSLATLGANSAPAIGGMLATFGVAQGMAVTAPVSSFAGVASSGGSAMQVGVPSYATGVKEVPYSGLAYLHSGERVMNQQEAATARRKEASGQGVDVYNVFLPSFAPGMIKTREGREAVVTVFDEDLATSGPSRRSVRR